MSTTNFTSIARDLAMPISPPTTPPLDSTRPPFRRIASAASRRRHANKSRTYSERAIKSATFLTKKVVATYEAMSWSQRIGVISFLIVVNVGGILFLVYNGPILAYFKSIAKSWAKLPGGWAILWALIFTTAFPPVVGYSALVNACGFVFGFWEGWLIACTAATLGSLASFIASRTVLSKYVHRLVGEDKRFQALALTLKHDGLKTLTLIRLCPLPYSLSNGALSTIPTLQPLSFALATLLSTPKLMIHVFIGSRFSALGEDEHMDTPTRIINYLAIAGGVILGAVLGYVIYQKTKARARELEEEERQLAGGESGNAEQLDDPESFEGNGMEDDDISLWGNDDEMFRDTYSDEEHANGAVYRDEGELAPTSKRT